MELLITNKSWIVASSWSHLYLLLYICLHVKCPLFLSEWNRTWNPSTDFQKIFKCQISWKSTPSFSVQTDRYEETTVIVAFRNSATEPKSTELKRNHKVGNVSCLARSLSASQKELWSTDLRRTLYKQLSVGSYHITYFNTFNSRKLFCRFQALFIKEQIPVPFFRRRKS